MKFKIEKYIVVVFILFVFLLSGCEKQEENRQNIKVETKKNPEEKKKDIVEEPSENRNNEILIVLDPGHQGWDVDMSNQEPNAPGSTEMKTKSSTGTQGNYSGIPEYQLNLDISLQVRDELEAQGYRVIMTREDNNTAISNAERATLANDNHADVMVRIHANSSGDNSVTGALALISSSSNPYIGSKYSDSYKLANNILDSYCKSTGMANLGIQENDTMTGINWSQVPVTIFEMGFMSNESDDMNMADVEYQKRMVQGIVSGINNYFEETKPGQVLENLSTQISEKIQYAINQNEQWSIYVKDLSNGNHTTIGNQKLQSASLIKLFTAATVYENIDVINATQAYNGEIEELMKLMITQSDNNAANELVKKLGNGDISNGMTRVNEFCKNHGFMDTHMGRLMLQPNDVDDNYTSVEDCGKLLEDFFNNTLSGSEQIIQYMKQQERVSKIPAGVPEEATTANKSGELDKVENDVAIITTDSKSFILCIMSNNIQASQTARTTIVELSSLVYKYIIHP